MGAERKIVHKRCFFVGNATTIKFWKCKFYCREIFVVIAQAPRKGRAVSRDMKKSIIAGPPHRETFEVLGPQGQGTEGGGGRRDHKD